MIKINLLPEKRKKKAKGPKNLVLSIVAANLSALLIVGGVTIWLKAGIAKLQEQSETNKAVIAKLTTKIKEVEKLKKLNQELQERSKLIEMLRKNQSIPVRVLDEVNMLIPDGVWLTSLVFKDNGISLEGNAFSNLDVVSFIDNLKKSTVLSDTYLEESRESAEQVSQRPQRGVMPDAKQAEKIKTYRFKVSFRVRA